MFRADPPLKQLSQDGSTWRPSFETDTQLLSSPFLAYANGWQVADLDMLLILDPDGVKCSQRRLQKMLCRTVVGGKLQGEMGDRYEDRRVT